MVSNVPEYINWLITSLSWNKADDYLRKKTRLSLTEMYTEKVQKQSLEAFYTMVFLKI